jgi:hypothetical protein
MMKPIQHQNLIQPVNPPDTLAAHVNSKEAARPLCGEGVTGRRPGLRSAVVSMGESTGRYGFSSKKQAKLATAARSLRRL